MLQAHKTEIFLIKLELHQSQNIDLKGQKLNSVSVEEFIKPTAFQNILSLGVVSAISSEHHREALGTHKLQEVMLASLHLLRGKIKLVNKVSAG